MDNNELNMLREKLKKKGYKLTPQRKAIINTIDNNRGEHLTVEQLYDSVKISSPEIGLATVYRTVQMLEEVEYINKLMLDDGCYRYEKNNEDEIHQHHHLICKKCLKVIEVKGDFMDTIEESIEKEYDFKIENHKVKFFGICKDCRNSRRRVDIE
ncbi:Fur family transcriptional regulator [Clostridium sp. DL1XJH146]